jgi:aspartyl/asparaginyl beta-hydroxylase (cupin superfamily)
MSAATPLQGAGRAGPPWVRSLKRAIKALVIVVPLGYFLPKTSLFFLLCGIYDVSRHKQIDRQVLGGYFLGNGVLTWLMSPLNALLDILCLPYRNKGVYKLEDLPEAYRQELVHVIDAATKSDLVNQLHAKAHEQARSMFFFKWYGKNIETDLQIPAFHQEYKYVKTIGVSVFNKREVTTWHFGYVRASLRVLYNINDFDDDSALIMLRPIINYWRDQKLFIFDDTLQHLSANNSDKPRYCMFIDIARPSYVPAVLKSVIDCIRVVTGRFNAAYYRRWKLIRP